MPMPGDALVVQKRTTWPDGYKFFYNCEFAERADVVECTVIWRGGTRSDLQNYRANLRLQSRMAGINEEENEPDDNTFMNVVKYFRLVEHIMGDGWRDDFLTMVGTYEVHGGGFQFKLYIRQLILMWPSLKT